MAFKASNVLPEQGYRRAKQQAVSLKAYCAAKSARYAAGASADDVLGTRTDLVQYRAELNSVTTIPGIAAYAQVQENDETYSVAIEFNALIALIDAVIANIELTFPVDSGPTPYLLEKEFDGSGGYTFRQFTGANLATLRGLLDNVVAGVE